MSEKEIKISDKQIIAWDALHDDETNEILYGGAAGGGKSFLGCLWAITYCLKYAGIRGLIGRSKLTNLKISTLNTFFEVAKLLNYDDYTFNAQSNIIKFHNGSEILLKDLFFYPSDPEFAALG